MSLRVALALAALVGLVPLLPLPGSAQPVGGEREALLARAEDDLARLDVTAALPLFERAASMAHRADSELGLVRVYMQDGQYRRALSFVAHTAAAHRDDPGGALLHAWLLDLGGQAAAARAIADEAARRWPGDARVAEVVKQVGSPMPIARGDLLRLPARLAPYGAIRGVSANARVAGSGTLLPDGVRVIVPIALLPPASALWVRNGIGGSSRASIERRYPDLGIAVLRLSTPLRVSGRLEVARRDAFPGSVAFAVGYASSADAQPAWPALRAGFVGDAAEDGRRRLPIDGAAAIHGGPVFDRRGALAGVAMPGTKRGDVWLLPVSRLPTVAHTAPLGDESARSIAASDEIYESGMLHAVQVVVAGIPVSTRIQDAH
ncbi:MAG: tetratricopeptide repeat protein [Burkholderiales bacterium]